MPQTITRAENNQENTCILAGFDLSLHSQKIKPLFTRFCRPNGGMVDTKDFEIIDCLCQRIFISLRQMQR